MSGFDDFWHNLLGDSKTPQKVISPLAEPSTGDSSPMFSNGHAAITPPTAQQAFHVEPKVKDFLENKVFPITDKYNIPRAVVAGQYAAEGRGGEYADRNNFFNINAQTSNPDAAFHYATPEEGIRAYAAFVTGKGVNYASPDVKTKFSDAYQTYDHMRDPTKYMDSIANAGYSDRKDANGNNAYSQFVQSTPEYQAYSDTNQ